MGVVLEHLSADVPLGPAHTRGDVVRGLHSGGAAPLADDRLVLRRAKWRNDAGHKTRPLRDPRIPPAAVLKLKRYLNCPGTMIPIPFFPAFLFQRPTSF